ncbi:hypothetical protein ACFL3T_01895 [Patescibacteria group bacterium]
MSPEISEELAEQAQPIIQDLHGKLKALYEHTEQGVAIIYNHLDHIDDNPEERINDPELLVPAITQYLTDPHPRMRFVLTNPDDRHDHVEVVVPLEAKKKLLESFTDADLRTLCEFALRFVVDYLQGTLDSSDEEFLNSKYDRTTTHRELCESRLKDAKHNLQEFEEMDPNESLVDAYL